MLTHRQHRQRCSRRCAQEEEGRKEEEEEEEEEEKEEDRERGSLNSQPGSRRESGYANGQHSHSESLEPECIAEEEPI